MVIRRYISMSMFGASPGHKHMCIPNLIFNTQHILNKNCQLLVYLYYKNNCVTSIYPFIYKYTKNNVIDWVQSNPLALIQKPYNLLLLLSYL
jgi:hypothetical protein